MRALGILLMLLGVVVVFLAFRMDATVSSIGSYIGGSLVGGGSTYNLGLLQNQMMIFQTGTSAFIAGAVLWGASEIVEARSVVNPITRVQPEESDEERDERIEQERRRHQIALIGAVTLLALLIGLAIWLSKIDDTSATMNVDENLMTIDMNAVEENVSTHGRR